MDKLKDQLAALLITRQVVGNIKESLLPYVVETLCLAEMTAKRRESLLPGAVTEGSGTTDEGQQADHQPDGVPERGPTQAEMEAAMYRYDGTFEDYLEMFIQFGYVVLFSSAFPLAALCALVNNLVEIRSDAFKLCAIFQRPFGEPAENIGSWQDAMEVMGMIAVIVNCALVGLNGQLGRMWPQLGPLETLAVVVLVEHLLLLLKSAIAFAIPDVPHWVQTEMAKVEFQRREAAKHHRQGIFSSTEMKPAHTQTDAVAVVDSSIQTGSGVSFDIQTGEQHRCHDKKLTRSRAQSASSSPPHWRRGLTVIGQTLAERL
ncbi:anoctamin-8-like [Tropilaelaps mercedesae]|uniref:Anoctamin n=1 Tax=Tropilaelaps mercedesae TaxID=418985 RepID=A0A1V9XCA9_9ACAR|nr:anoctamin-8-like [Tropilaelaps mercedesae]